MGIMAPAVARNLYRRADCMGAAFFALARASSSVAALLRSQTVTAAVHKTSNDSGWYASPRRQRVRRDGADLRIKAFHHCARVSQGSEADGKWQFLDEPAEVQPESPPKKATPENREGPGPKKKGTKFNPKAVNPQHAALWKAAQTQGDEAGSDSSLASWKDSYDFTYVSEGTDRVMELIEVAKKRGYSPHPKSKEFFMVGSPQKAVRVRDFILEAAEQDPDLSEFLTSKIGGMAHLVECLSFTYLYKELQIAEFEPEEPDEEFPEGPGLGFGLDPVEDDTNKDQESTEHTFTVIGRK
ncbi:hypothetical protein FVE85_5443 [Porphyridium purpureum]|uniref:Uncharacterized protein n=1 Tax=Porphyridium purpureum TaxID=35688 RepID=A0A5J4Z3R1_PORPP|nr:hypothetical protein FVE85_5443 [Porphyridium purpureum]|eukprot:POR1666..scf295_1